MIKSSMKRLGLRQVSQKILSLGLLQPVKVGQPQLNQAVALEEGDLNASAALQK